MEQREQNHVLHGLCRVATEEDESQMKEIKEIFRFAYCAQPVPKALSVISFISAGLEILCAACAGGTFCDFLRPFGSKRAELERRDFCVKKYFFYFLYLTFVFLCRDSA